MGRASLINPSLNSAYQQRVDAKPEAYSAETKEKTSKPCWPVWRVREHWNFIEGVADNSQPYDRKSADDKSAHDPWGHRLSR